MSYRVGNIRVDVITEINEPVVDALWLFKGMTRETLDANRDKVPHGSVEDGTTMLWMPAQSFLLRTDDRTVLIDTGVGNHRANPKFLAWNMKSDTVFFDRLAELGVTAESIDTVVHTHLHADHFGWDTRLVDGAWVPTFPKARYVMSRNEYEYWSTRWRDQGRLTFGDSVEVIVAAGLADLVADDAEIVPGVRLHPVPGHTPHNATLHLSSNGEEAFIGGDWIHSPLQCELTDILDESDTDAEAGRRNRNRMMAQCAARGTLVAPTHFPAPALGRFAADGDRFRWVPVSG